MPALYFQSYDTYAQSVSGLEIFSLIWEMGKE
jgi:hypothetical protein